MRLTPLQTIKDRVLVLGVACLVAIDLIILITYTLVEGIRGSIDAQQVSHREEPTEVSIT